MEESARFEPTPAIITIFGATGNLSYRKLIPSLYGLERDGLLHDATRIIGIVRRDMSASQLVDLALPDINDRKPFDEAALKRLVAKIETFQMDLTSNNDYVALRNHLDAIEDRANTCMSRLFYLAIPPQISKPIITLLGENGLNLGSPKYNKPSQLLMEKPFGFSAETARELVKATRVHFSEEQIFRIDHYLAKETVQNILVFRFRNPIFQHLWSSQHITSIYIQADESIDIDGRINFYEQTGALRDLIQSHLLHVASILLMPRPDDLTDSDAIHAMRQYALDHIEPTTANQMQERVIRGQYESYREEVNNDQSDTETFASVALYSRDETWRNVPVYVRTGKALHEKRTRIVVTFAPHHGDTRHINRLIFSIAPTEGIEVELWAKQPGFSDKLKKVSLDFTYDDAFENHRTSDAYDRVLIDAIRGDNTLFATSEQIMSSWRILQPILDAWSSSDGSDLIQYKRGSHGADLGHKTTP